MQLSEDFFSYVQEHSHHKNKKLFLLNCAHFPSLGHLWVRIGIEKSFIESSSLLLCEFALFLNVDDFRVHAYTFWLLLSHINNNRCAEAFLAILELRGDMILSMSKQPVC